MRNNKRKQFLEFWDLPSTWTPERFNMREAEERISETKDWE
jgi:hypothetical protein